MDINGAKIMDKQILSTSQEESARMQYPQTSQTVQGNVQSQKHQSHRFDIVGHAAKEYGLTEEKALLWMDRFAM